jgi:PAS domain S-box-containing protein
MDEGHRIVLDLLSDPVWLKDGEGRYVFVNEAFLSLFGLSAREVVGKRDEDLFSGDAAGQYLAHEETVKREGGRRSFAEPLETAGGRRIMAETIRMAIYGHDRNLLGTAGIASVPEDWRSHPRPPRAGRDKTKQGVAEEALGEAEEKYRAIYEHAVGGIFQATPDGRFLSANPALARILGYESKEELMEAVGARGKQIYVSERRWSEYLHLMEAHGHVHDFEVQVHPKEGGPEWVSVNSRSVRDAEGRVLHYEGTMESITERKKLEAQLLQAQKMESIGTLAGGVAHDFNNILTTIMGYCSLIMMKTGKAGPITGYLNQIMEAADRASGLTQSLLAFSRKQVMETKTIDVNETIRAVEKLLRRIIGEDIELKTSPSQERLVVTVGDGQIGQLLMNLASNARDAMPEGGVLSIRTELVHLSGDFMKTYDGKEGVYAAIEVSDTGSGMDERTKDQIFDPFFTTKEVGRGTGLGLSIVYGIVRQNKGYVNVGSQPGKGTTFTLYLPLTEPAQDTGSLQERAELRGGSEVILVAEDNTQVREILTATLSDFGYGVIEAVDGMDAVEKFNRHRQGIDLLLLDVIMPRKNGKEAYMEIKKIRPDIRTIFMSGYTGDILSKKGISREGIPMTSKPIVIEKLLRQIREILDTKPSQLSLFP